jgi:Holliday junction resolvase RusA-like endonuclease
MVGNNKYQIGEEPTGANQETGKVFDSAGAGRFQFETAQIQHTPEQLAEQERQKQKQAERKEKTKMSLRIAIGAVILAFIGMMVFLIVVSLTGRNRTLFEIGDFSFTERDVDNLVENMQDYMDRNPGTGFGDDLRLTAIYDLSS